MRKWLRRFGRRCSDWISLHPYVYLTLPDVRPLATDPRTTAFIDLRKREAQESGRALTIRQRWGPVQPDFE